MAKADPPVSGNLVGQKGLLQGVISGLQRATYGGSIVTHMTWIVLAGIAGEAVVTSSSFADGTVKKWGIVAVAALSFAGLGTLIWTSVSPLANVLGKDIPDTLRAVQEKGRRGPVDPAKLRSTPPTSTPKRREKGTNV